MTTVSRLLIFFAIGVTLSYSGRKPIKVRMPIIGRSTIDGRAIIKTLTVPNGGPWGVWSEPEYCAKGYYVTGYSMKIEPKQGGGNRNDDTSLNAIRLRCSEGQRCFSDACDRTGGTIVGQEGPRGNWGKEKKCLRGRFMTSFALQVEKPQGGGTNDDTAANYVKFKCRPFYGVTSGEDLGGSGFWGSFGNWSDYCPRNSAICGMKVKIAPWQGSGVSGGDDTVLNDAAFYCCKYQINTIS